MRGIISIAVLTMILSGCGKEVKLERRAVMYPNGKTVMEDWTITRMPNGDTLLHGVRRKLFWNGTNSESVMWNMGQKHGTSLAWYESGEMKWQKAFEKGEPKGTWRLFYRDGKPWINVNHEKSQIHGTVEVWDRTGSGEPRKAEFAKGACVSGDCSLLEAPAVPSDITAAEKVEMTRSWDIIREFLES